MSHFSEEAPPTDGKPLSHYHLHWSLKDFCIFPRSISFQLLGHGLVAVHSPLTRPHGRGWTGCKIGKGGAMTAIGTVMGGRNVNYCNGDCTVKGTAQKRGTIV